MRNILKHSESLIHPLVQSNPRPSMKCVSTRSHPPPYSRVSLYYCITVITLFIYLCSLYLGWRHLAHESMSQQPNGSHHEAQHNGIRRYHIPLQCVKIYPSSLEEIQKKQMYPCDGCDPGIFQHVCHGGEAPACRARRPLLLKHRSYQIDHPIMNQ